MSHPLALAQETLAPQDDALEALKAEVMPESLEGVSRLLESGNARGAATLASQILAESASMSVSPKESLLLRSYKVVALLCSGQYQEASGEIDAIGDVESLSEVPFMLRFARAQAPLFARGNKSPAPLYDLLAFCRKSVKEACGCEEAVALWGARERFVLSAIATRHCAAQEWAPAIEALERVVDTSPKPDGRALSALGRVYLQVGAVVEAGAVFREAEGVAEDHECQTNAALMKFANGDYQGASDAFLRMRDASQDERWMTANNNVAVASLYGRNPSKTLSLLRRGVCRDPQMVCETTHANSCVMYDLLSDTPEKHKLDLATFLAKTENPRLKI